MSKACEQLSLAFIVAMANNCVIGRDNALPWHLPEDLRFFRQHTMGKPMLMGRHTYESIGRPLPGRDSIVVSSRPDFRPEGVQVAADIESGLALAEAAGRARGASEIMVIGGAHLYAALLPRAQRLYLTRVRADVQGDTFFPPLEWNQWREIERTELAAGAQRDIGLSFLVLTRIACD